MRHAYVGFCFGAAFVGAASRVSLAPVWMTVGWLICGIVVALCCTNPQSWKSA